MSELESVQIARLRQQLLEYSQLFWLASRDIIFFVEGKLPEPESLEKHAVDDRGGWHAAVLLNDVFGYACADAETIFPGQAAEIKTFYETFGWDGVIAWVANARNQEPLKELRTEKYLQAGIVLLGKASPTSPKPIIFRPIPTPT